MRRGAPARGNERVSGDKTRGKSGDKARVRVQAVAVCPRETEETKLLNTTWVVATTYM